MTETEQIQSVNLPPEFESYINEKLEWGKNGKAGRPNFIQQLAKEDREPLDEVLNILERAWLKNQTIGKIQKDYKASYHTIWRLVKDLEPFKEPLIEYLTLVPRKKTFFNPELGTSDYETVRAFIKRAKRDKVQTYEKTLRIAKKFWKHLRYRDPAKWSAQQVIDYLDTLLEGSQSFMLDCIRQVAPQIRDDTSDDYVSTGRYREKLRRRKKDIFGKEVNLIRNALTDKGMNDHLTKFELHITLGAREGSRNPNSGMCGITWDKFKKNFTKLDLYESKVRGGIIWCDCPLDLFFRHLPKDVRNLWESKGKPIDEKVFVEGYRELLQIYKEIRQALKEYYEGKLEPSLYKELTTLKPHDADKIHVNLLWEAGVPLEVVAGQYIGRGEGIGLMGRGWLDINTIKKHYLSLTQRSERFQKLMKQVQKYSYQFNGD